jgi:hypothetical protein
MKNRDAITHLALPFPFVRNQLFPLATQSFADSLNSRYERIDFTCLNPANSSRVQIGQFGKPLLTHFKRHSDSPDVASKFRQFCREFGFRHGTLPEKFEVDIKGLLRPNRQISLGMFCNESVTVRIREDYRFCSCEVVSGF